VIGPAAGGGPDGVAVRRWFVLFAAYLAVLAIPTAWMLADLGRPPRELLTHPGQFTEAWHQLAKLLIFAGYLSFCCTFLPLPTGWLVAAIATREVALAPNLAATAVLVGLAGGVGSMMANLNDYHFFTLLLRHRRVAAVRRTRLFGLAHRWFSRAPFSLLVIFNVVPIPVDVIRMLAATGRYPRVPFAAANFVGRFIRYALLAALAYELDLTRLQASVIMLGVAVVLGLARVLPAGARRVRARRPATGDEG